MKCPKCVTENPETNKFCRECGAKLTIICPQCSFECPPQDKFCGKCGHNLHKPKAYSPIDYNEPQSYTPKHLADKILSNRIVIEGERKLVTIMFVDVADSTAMFENLDPEQVHEIMDGCFRILMDEIHRYEGTINQFLGDGVMALFGAPIAHEDHARRACYAALTIQTDLKPFAEKLHTEYGIDFKLRIGLNSGGVVVGAIGDDLRMDYTAQGDTANLAARMEHNAAPGSILVSKHTYRLAKAFFDFRPEGTIQVKGKAEPIEAYRLIKPSEVETRIEASTVRGLTKFVGRKREIETLREAFEKARSGEGQVVGVVGEAGVGKSRLLLEFRNSLPKGECVFLEGRCLHYGSFMPYLPILDALRSYLGIKEGEKESVIKQKMDERIVGRDNALMRCLPPIQELFSVTVDDEEFAGLEPKDKREKTFESLRDILVRGSQSRPIVWAVEDLHWIDKTTEDFLDYLIGRLPGARILLILLYRPEYTHQWGSKSYYGKIGVGQLSSSTSAELVHAILEGAAVLPELRDLILSRTAGNPLFMEELTHSLLENGSVQKEVDQYVLVRNASEIQVPDTIQGIIAARMDRLEESLKRIMQVASVIGREFAFRVLETITEMKDDLKSNLLNLQGLEFIYEKSLFPELEYIFRHALTQEVAYNSLLLKRRKEIHERIGRAIEELYPDRLEEFYEMLAYHFSRSGQAEKAAGFLKLAGTRAMRNNSLWEAFHFFKDALGSLEELPDNDENKAGRVELFLLLVAPVRLLGFPEGSLDLLRSGDALARQIGDRTAFAALHSALGIYYSTAGGNPEMGRQYVEECLEDLENIDYVHSITPIGYDACYSYFVRGEIRKLESLTANVLKLLENAGEESGFFGRPANPYCMLLGWHGCAQAEHGHCDEGKHFIDRGRAFADQLDHLITRGVLEQASGFLHVMLGDFKTAADDYRQALKCYEQAQAPLFMGVTKSAMGYATYMSGEPRGALSLIEEGCKIHENLGMPLWLSFIYWFLGEVRFFSGDSEGGRADLAKAVQLGRQNGEGFTEGCTRISYGMALGKSTPGEFKKAESEILHGIKIQEQRGSSLWSSVGYFRLGELYGDAGQTHRALENLKKAEAMFRDMGMDYWLGKTEESLAKL